MKTTTSTIMTLLQIFLYYISLFIVLPIGMHFLLASLMPNARLLDSIIGALQILFTIILINYHHCKLIYLKYANSILRFTLVTLAATAGLFIFSILARFLTPSPPLLLPAQGDTESLILLLHTLILVICEELFFRLFLQNSLKKIILPAGAIFLSAVIFAAGHSYQGSQGILSAFFAGMILGWASHTEKSIIPGLTAHLSYNLLLIFMS